MENKVSSVLSASSAQLINLGSTDFYNASYSKTILENVIRNLEELCLKISVKPKPESKLPAKCNKAFTVEFELKKEYPYYFLLRRTDKSNPDSSSDEINHLLHRLQMLQEFYILLLETVKFTFDNLKSMYDQKLYDIIITKREVAPLPLQEYTAPEQGAPEELDESTQANPTKEVAVRQDKTEQDVPSASKPTQVKPVLHGKKSQGEPSPSKSTQVKPPLNVKTSQGKPSASKPTQVKPVLQGKTPQGEPSASKHTQVKPTKEASIPQDDASTNKKEEPIDEAGPSINNFVRPAPVKEQTTKSPINHKEEKSKAAPKKRKLSPLEGKAIKKQNTTEYPIPVDKLSNLLIIGPNGTTIKKNDYEGLQLKGAPGATRLLCDLIFGDEILASHSLTGNQSPAFRGRERPLKKQLDPLKTADIQHLVCSKFNVSQQLVRATITTKCADSTKKLKRLSLRAM